MRIILKSKILLLLLLVMTAGFRCSFLTPAAKELLEPIELTWWGVVDDAHNFDAIIGTYRSVHPNVSISYRQLRPEEFEGELLEALAEDRGPDIFSIHNTWVTKYISKIQPLPENTTMAYEITQRSLGIKEETLVEVRETPSITPAQLRIQFIDVVFNDVVRDSKIYGLPLSVDTLALFYNVDLLNNAGIPLPPTTWLGVQDNVRKLTQQNRSGELVLSGIAIGSANNVTNGSDVISLLMMQNGADMTQGNRASFQFVPAGFPDRTYNPGPEAIRFYTDFANTGKEVYTWDERFGNSIDAFAQGTTAMMFGYSRDRATLEAKRQGKLNFGITPVPQIEGRIAVNFADYWVQTVSSKSKNVNAAWDFIQFMSKKDQVRSYLTKTGQPTALRSLIEEQLTDDGMAVFAQQLLTSTSWYRGRQPEIVDGIFSEMIQAVLAGEDAQTAADTAAQKIDQSL